MMHSAIGLASTAREQKYKVASSLIGSRPDTSEFTVEANYHGVPTRFFCANSLMQEVLQKFLPMQWLMPQTAGPLKVLDIFWLDPKNFFEDSSWQEDSDPECAIFPNKQGETAVQRDFVGSLDHRSFAVIIANPSIDDGFFNALRWLLPRQMVQKNSLLLHSSCVVGKNGLAYFFLGPSGAGKTTLSEMSQGRKVLGDDMNVIHVNETGLTAEAGVLGQRHSNPALFSHKFPVGGIFWLKQGSENKVHLGSQRKTAMRLLSSAANLFWPQTEPALGTRVLSMIQKIERSQVVKELEFNLDGGFWKHVENQ